MRKGSGKKQKEYEAVLLNPPFCACACGGRITVIPSQKYNGVPKYIQGHYSKGKTLEEAFGKEFADNFIKRNKASGSRTKGKTYEELYGEEKATKLLILKSSLTKGRLSPLKGKTYEEIMGVEKSIKVKKDRSKCHKGKIVLESSKQKIRDARLKQVIPFNDTEPELILQKALREFIEIETHAHLYGQPDIKINNLLIFVDGNFWHANPERYVADTEMMTRGSKKLTAQDIWDKDKKITKYLEDKGHI